MSFIVRNLIRRGNLEELILFKNVCQPNYIILNANCAMLFIYVIINNKEAAIYKGKYLMHNKEQQMHEAYYSEIADEILKYDHVLLFGPTNAKTELYNYLNKDLHFKDLTIDVKSSDKMSQNEKFAFVRNHFQK
jgi:hypothetical protein